jgi:hypothetical protein
MLKFLRGKEHRTYLKYSRGRVIDMSSDDDQDQTKTKSDNFSDKLSDGCDDGFDEANPHIKQLKHSFKHLLV